MSTGEMNARGWDSLDFILITGDAYVDHPSFGVALIGRLLESRGYRVGVISQPDWKSVDDFRQLGRPRLGFLVSGGNIDSMVSNYTVAHKPRRQDAYSPGGIGGRRPDRASIVYAVRAREAFKKVPVILGGLEASLRRLAHYDFWSDTLRRSILLDAKADLLVYGMGERQITEIADRLAAGEPVSELHDIRGTVWKTTNREEIPEGAVFLPALTFPPQDKTVFGESFMIQYRNTDPYHGKVLVEVYGNELVVQNKPAMPLEEDMLDAVYELPYTRNWHPSYDALGGVPGLEEVKFSLVSSRGCFGGCSFCALTFHQGRIIQGRSHESLIHEAGELIDMKGFKGYIHDVGGPTANFRYRACAKQDTHGACADKQCLYPAPCGNLRVDHKDYLTLLRKLRVLPGVKKVFIRSGIRFDYLMADKDDTFFRELIEHHVSGQLKVAPEHVSERVLDLMGKPAGNVYAAFAEKFAELNRRAGKKQFLVPYLISSHPGSTIDDALELVEYLLSIGYTPEQVQDFYPTPGTLSTCMYYTGVDPRTGRKIPVARGQGEKNLQRALLQFRDPKNRQLIERELMRMGLGDVLKRLYGGRTRPEHGPVGTGRHHSSNRHDVKNQTNRNSGPKRKRRP